ncbi:uncharacterized protein L201_003433 [Kwoniella dendrophila CBS 6074]|uniref:RNase III domain-containing protein n=1 Tax=Kwoniella dendrophila CBS 6074 TaxID=1295534 RepID=A0AAX4JSX0_9TREE
MRYNSENNPLFSFILPPLPRFKLPQPPLPYIKDKELFEQVITHVSIKQLTRRSVMALAKPTEEHEKANDYERLEHVGDGLLESIATGIIQDLYPWLRQGGAAIIRDHLFSNQTLAQISVLYNIPSIIKADFSSVEHVRSSEKIQASVLEAWIAGIFYSFLQHGEGGYISIDGEGEISFKENVAVNSLGKSHNEVAEIIDDQPDSETDISSEEDDTTEIVTEGKIPKGLQPILQPTKITSTTTDKLPNKEPISHIADLESMISMMFTSTIDTIKAKTPGTPKVIELVEDNDTINKSETTSSADISLNDQLRLSRSVSKIHLNGDDNDLEDEVTTTQSIALLPPPTYSHTFTVPQRSRTKGQAYDYLISWLTPLLTPYCEWIYTLLLEEQTKILSDLPIEIPKLITPDHWKDEDRKSLGMVQALSQHPWIKGAGNRPIYEKVSQNGQRWKIVCRVMDLDGKEWSGEAIRPNVQAAKNVAAWMVYRQLGQ